MEITKPLVKYELVMGDKKVDITQSVSSWSEFIIKELRDGVTGVSIDVTAPIDLVSFGKKLVDSLVEESGLYAEASINVYLRKPGGSEYELKKTIILNFETYDSDTDVTSIQATDNSLQDLIKSGKNTKFDIPVSEIREESPFSPYRLNLVSSANYIVTEVRTTATPDSQIGQRSLIGLSLQAVETSNDATQHEGQTQLPALVPGNQFDGGYFFKAKGDVTVNLSMKFDIVSNRTSGLWSLYLVKNYVYPQGDIVHTWPNTDYGFGTFLSVNEDMALSLQEDDTLSLVIVSGLQLNTGEYFEVTNAENLKVTWETKAANVNIDVIKPETLLQAYLDRMSETEGVYTGEIQWNETFVPMLCAAESIRGFTAANLNGKLVDLIDWLEVLGYEYYYEENKIIFAPRDNFFRPDIEAMRLSAKEVSNMKIKAYPDKAYTLVEIGYDKQDYESVNGRFEVNGTYNYQTGYRIAKEDTTLSLISPYRSDSIGLELLLWQRGKDTTDTSSDNDIFALQLYYVASVDKYSYSLENAMRVEGVGLYNGSLSPYFLAKRNESLIGINSKKLTFASTDSNREAITESGVDIYADIEITKKLFEPFKYTFDTGNHLDLPDVNNRNGLIAFEFEGTVYYGFVSDISKYYGAEKDTEWELFKYKKE